MYAHPTSRWDPGLCDGVCDDIFFIRFYVESSSSLKGGSERRGRKEYNDLSARLPRDILTPACARVRRFFCACESEESVCVCARG